MKDNEQENEENINDSTSTIKDIETLLTNELIDYFNKSVALKANDKEYSSVVEYLINKIKNKILDKNEPRHKNLVVVAKKVFNKKPKIGDPLIQ